MEITISKQIGGVNVIKWQVFKKDRKCNPIVGNKKIDGSCFKIRLNETQQISDAEWEKFIYLIDKFNFWKLPLKIDKEGFDGSDWTIQGSKSKTDSSKRIKQIYKSVYRWTPEKGTSVYEIGQYLLDLNDYNWGEIY